MQVQCFMVFDTQSRLFGHHYLSHRYYEECGDDDGVELGVSAASDFVQRFFFRHGRSGRGGNVSIRRADILKGV